MPRQLRARTLCPRRRRVGGEARPHAVDRLPVVTSLGRIYVPGDAAAVSVGADRVAQRIADVVATRGIDAEIVRTGTRGMLWMEPLVEIDAPGGRIGFGPVSEHDVADLLALGRAHPLCIGPVAAHPFLATQQRVTFARCGVVDPTSVDEYRRHAGLRGLYRALDLGPEAIVEAVTESGLRGRGGAGFPTGIKWQTVARTPADARFVVCNADEGDSGTFADRMLMEGDPFALIEGMVIAGLAVGAERGFVYIRSEYPYAIRRMQEAVDTARRDGFLGRDLLGSGHHFDIEIRRGAGAYICGEETALLESLEGRRGQVRPKPPLPAISGLFGRPTVVNNVLTLAAVPTILAEGSAYYRDLGVGRSRGTMPIQLSGNVARGGLVERAFGLTLREIVEEYGGGTRSGRPVRAVQVGGPLGAYWPTALLDTPFDYEAFLERGGMIGHGGVVVFDDSVDLAEQARFAFEFCAEESCGKCTPCRLGATRGRETMERILAGERIEPNIELVRDLCEVMRDGSLCALGGLTPMPVLSALEHFHEDFARR
ncbi:MAG: NADH-quinone oxidoreductase subunit NuoF [Ectothiorhodospiraceae bacterium]|nr:NADH-quinone oxidoreductase subunit NuoF [Ectothiorhodospiraceae bacterium]